MEPRGANKEASAVDALIKARRAGWANDPKASGSVLVERATGCVFLSSNGKPITSTLRLKFPPALRIDKGKFRAHVGFFEGVIQYMYLDVGGNVTVGLGHLLASADKAKGLPFLDRNTKVISHKKHVENAFNLVKNSGFAGAPASKFKNLTHMDLSRTAIEQLFDADVDEFVKQLGFFFKGYETYPAKVQLAMLDMAYTMGTKNFFDIFKKFRAALALRNWIRLADESERSKQDSNGVPIPNMPARNSIVKQWILDAIKEQPFFINPACPPKLVS